MNTQGPQSCLADIHALLDAQHARDNIAKLFEISAFLLEDRVKVGPARSYYHCYARFLGYDIPPYPLAGCGEIKAFFKDWGVNNVPEWYESIGISPEEYAHLPEQTMFVVRNFQNERCAFLLPRIVHQHDKGFINLYASHLEKTLNPAETEQTLATIFGFMLRGDTQNKPVFHQLKVYHLPKTDE